MRRHLLHPERLPHRSRRSGGDDHFRDFVAAVGAELGVGGDLCTAFGAEGHGYEDQRNASGQQRGGRAQRLHWLVVGGCRAELVRMSPQ